MKKLFFILISILSINGYSGELDGVSSISSGIKSFFDPLKKGPKNIDEAISNVPGIDGESRTFAESQVSSDKPSLKNELKKIMVSEQQGKVVEYKEIDSREKLNGSYVIKTYSVKFYGGKTKTLEFRFLKPTINGNYHFVDAKMVD